MTGFLFVIFATALFHVVVLGGIAIKIFSVYRQTMKGSEKRCSRHDSILQSIVKCRDCRKFVLWGTVAILSAIALMNEIICLVILGIGKVDNYSLLRHRCRTFSQMPFEEAVKEYGNTAQSGANRPCSKK
jgi:hypothetical protein